MLPPNSETLHRRGAFGAGAQEEAPNKLGIEGEEASEIRIFVGLASVGIAVIYDPFSCFAVLYSHSVSPSEGILKSKNRKRFFSHGEMTERNGSVPA